MDAARITVGRSAISTEIVTQDERSFAVNVPSPSSSPASHGTVGVHAVLGSLVAVVVANARRTCRRRALLMSGASSSIRVIAVAP